MTTAATKYARCFTRQSDHGQVGQVTFIFSWIRTTKDDFSSPSGLRDAVEVDGENGVTDDVLWHEIEDKWIIATVSLRIGFGERRVTEAKDAVCLYTVAAYRRAWLENVWCGSS